MAKPVKFLLLLLGLAACAFSVWVARQSGTSVYYVDACLYALIGIGAFGFPPLREMAAGHLTVRTWWGRQFCQSGCWFLLAFLQPGSSRLPHNKQLQRTVMDKVPRHIRRRATAELRRYADS
jgi:hypothetical protein